MQNEFIKQIYGEDEFELYKVQKNKSTVQKYPIKTILYTAELQWNILSSEYILRVGLC